MSWNYRIVHYAYGGYMLREVFYDAEGKPTKHGAAGPDRTLYETPEEIAVALELMAQACKRPVLSDTVFTSEVKPMSREDLEAVKKRCEAAQVANWKYIPDSFMSDIPALITEVEALRLVAEAAKKWAGDVTKYGALSVMAHHGLNATLAALAEWEE
jgi:hypothetical protein